MDGRTLLLTTGPEEPPGEYVAALRGAGVDGDDIRIVTAENQGDDLRGLAAQAAGIVLCGGADVDPGRYGQAALPAAAVASAPERDALEIALLEVARTNGTPVFGICRGLQVLNVFLGGTLWQDLTLQRPSDVRHAVEPQSSLAHDVALAAEDHPFVRALGADVRGLSSCAVNSSHHQAVRNLAPGAQALAHSADGLIEALALPLDGPWWAAAVQWHPESLLDMPSQRALFTAFLAATRQRAALSVSGARSR